MQNDALTWELLGKGMCSFKRVLDTDTLCINEYNVTGLCTKKNCPLSNSVYATVILDKGELYLYIKTAERCHLPRRMWNRILLSPQKKEAFNVIYKEMKYLFSVNHIKKCMSRYARLKEIIKRSRKLALQKQLKLQPVKKKTEKRDKAREEKALVSANILTHVERELLNRLNEGTYGNLYSFTKSSKRLSKKGSEMASMNKLISEKLAKKKHILHEEEEQEQEQELLQKQDDSDEYYEKEDEYESGDDEFESEFDEDEFDENEMEQSEFEDFSNVDMEEEEEEEEVADEEEKEKKGKIKSKKKEKTEKKKQKRKYKYVKEYIDDDHIKKLQNEGKLPHNDDIEELNHKIKKRKTSTKKNEKKLIRIAYEN